MRTVLPRGLLLAVLRIHQSREKCLKEQKKTSDASHRSMAGVSRSPRRLLTIKNRGRWRFLQPAKVFGHRLPEAGKLLDLFMATCQGLPFPTLSYSLKFAV